MRPKSENIVRTTPQSLPKNDMGVSATLVEKLRRNVLHKRLDWKQMIHTHPSLLRLPVWQQRSAWGARFLPSSAIPIPQQDGPALFVCSAPTGCGKSSLVPLMLLDAHWERLLQRIDAPKNTNCYGIEITPPLPFASATEINIVCVLLPLCDAVRDEWLVQAGIRIEDSPAGPTTWKSDDRDLLLREMTERKQRQHMERRKKLENQIETKRKLTEKWRQYTYTPLMYFREREGAKEAKERIYAAFDADTGLPTKLTTGEVVNDKEQKKLSKELAKYTKTHEEFIAKGGVTWLEEQDRELMELRKALENLS
ncbi:hypothetical protein LSM04_005985 [Trypanosoma melophagium]|uniref:uncharacterized protein n=1 Tax=Trypanosoma melophagium TaxID=715481 RepID=UPI00351A6421|nr:hypothetical protein LSM04_005985 [Trypanosoma melophagium]